MTTMRASIWDEVLAELRGGNGLSSIDNVPSSSSVHRPGLDIDKSFSREVPKLTAGEGVENVDCRKQK
ncbi:hypothetical protein LguiA_029492 [Lonicera macranthoides]